MTDSEHAGPKQAILLLEDEPVSAEFLSAALAPLGLDVCHAGSLAQARALLRQRRFALLLLDLSLPDGSGSALLTEIGMADGGPSRGATALALTAELDEARRASLRALGFADALAKPIAAAALRDAVRSLLTNSATPQLAEPADLMGAPAVWDDVAALAACGGSLAVLSALRGLFQNELPEQLATIRHGLQTGLNSQSLDELHRLLAGCGFCGARELAGSARSLMQRVREGGDLTPAMAEFETAVARILDAGLRD